MADELRVGKIPGGPPGSALLHLYRPGKELTLCHAYKVSQLITPGAFDDRICPACADTLSSSHRQK